MKGTSSRVLIVDDEPLVSGLLRDFLTTGGDEVAIAASGADALKIVPVFQPDVILTDMSTLLASRRPRQKSAGSEQSTARSTDISAST